VVAELELNSVKKKPPPDMIEEEKKKANRLNAIRKSLSYITQPNV